MNTKGNTKTQDLQKDGKSGGDINEAISGADEAVSTGNPAEDSDESMSDIDAMLRELNLDMRRGRRMPEQAAEDFSDLQTEEFNEVSIEDMLEDVEIRDRSRENAQSGGAESGDGADASSAENAREKKRREKQAQKQARKEAKAERKSRKAKKETGGEEEEQDASPKAGGLKGLFNKLTEEAEEEEEAAAAKGGEADDLDEDSADAGENAKQAAAQKKKAKKDQKAKAKKEKEKKAAEKSKAKAKAAKAKPAKKKPEEKPAEKPGKRLKKGSVLIICLFAASVLGMILFINMLLSPILEKRSAQEAFREKDYASCYRLLAGMELSDEDARIRQYAEVVLKMSKRMERYAYYRSVSGELEALDCLITTVAEYDALYPRAAACGAEGETNDIYMRMVGILSEEYGVSEDLAKQIAACESRLEYTRYLERLISGDRGGELPGESDSPQPGGSQEEETDVPDLLPEEEEMQDANFSH